MEIQSKGEAVELIFKALPYSNQITDLDVDQDKSIYFSWRRKRFKLCLLSGTIGESNGSLLIGSDEAILMSALIKLKQSNP